MHGIQLVNALAGLLVITSLLVIEAKKPATSAILYALQSSVLVLVFLALAATTRAHELYVWSGTAFVTKVVLVPVIMYRALGSLHDPATPEGGLGATRALLLAAAVVVLSFLAVSSVQLPAIAELKPALAISLAHFFLGLTCIVTQRNILKQIFGYCLMENGSHLTLALMAPKAPEIVEIGIATDAIFAVIIMVVIGTRIFRTLGTLDSRQLTELKG
ncbi:hydrogenase 4 membrane subunit [Azospirillum halopraeferens]|uniref:hydrogenase 4 membrane subunit n=1 Tax=Azospirillum halopraeferens TaxID=34010 RepID=UPI0004183D27|nr:hydrogenase 4 membrane subunit [Azospirillum halopraeferens]